jgi:homoserine dehydrogenase
MGRYDLALIGFGGVNRALAGLISQSGKRLAEELGFALRVVAITDLRAGSLVDTNGIDLPPLLAAEPGELNFAGLAGGSADPRNEWVIREVPADIVAEATFTNPVDGEPALSHVHWALEALALILFGAGFALKALWWIAVIVLVIWLLGFVVRTADTSGRKGRWYRW